MRSGLWFAFVLLLVSAFGRPCFAMAKKEASPFSYRPASAVDSARAMKEAASFLKTANLADFDSVSVREQYRGALRTRSNFTGYSLDLFFLRHDTIRVSVLLSWRFALNSVNNSLERITDVCRPSQDAPLIRRVDGFCRAFNRLSSSGRLYFDGLETCGKYYHVYYSYKSTREIEAIQRKAQKTGMSGFMHYYHHFIVTRDLRLIGFF